MSLCVSMMTQHTPHQISSHLRVFMPMLTSSSATRLLAEAYLRCVPAARIIVVAWSLCCRMVKNSALLMASLLPWQGSEVGRAQLDQCTGGRRESTTGYALTS